MSFSSLNGKQLQQLLKDSDIEKEVRVWVENKNQDGVKYLKGYKLIGVIDDPNDKYLCLIASSYQEESE